MWIMLTYPRITGGVNKHSKVSSGQSEHCLVDQVLFNVCIFYRSHINKLRAFIDISSKSQMGSNIILMFAILKISYFMS